jgi:hypothetical protein
LGPPWALDGTIYLTCGSCRAGGKKGNSDVAAKCVEVSEGMLFLFPLPFEKWLGQKKKKEKM